LVQEDEAFKSVLNFYLPRSVRDAVTPDLLRVGDLVHDPSVLAWTADAERNVPYVKAFDTWGRSVSTLVTSEGWRNLQDLGIKEGVVAIGYENQFGAYSRVYQFLKYHLWTPNSAVVTCPSAMQDGAARLLSVQLANKDIKYNEMERKILEAAYERLTSRDPSWAWTSGQWMTERPGGSDVRNTETQATYAPVFAEGSSNKDINGNPLGPWELNGFKWFSSATDSQMAIAIAKMPSGSLSAFYIPMRRQVGPSTELNGISIQRLKSKLGTKAVPTAELVLKGTRAYLLGNEGQGVKTIATILNITRVHTSIGSMGFWGGGLAIARAFARVRSTSGKLLIDTPAHMHTLAQEHVQYRAMMHLAFFSVALLGISEAATTTHTTSHAPYSIKESESASAAAAQLGIDPKTATVLLRLLTPVTKAVPSRCAIVGLQECMEALGGVGYLENEEIEFNIARLFRDVNVNSIWEGTTNVLAHDVMRVLKSSRDGGPTLQAMNQWLDAGLGGWDSHIWIKRAAGVRAIWAKFKDQVVRKTSDELLFQGRELMWDLAWIVSAVLLGQDARSTRDAVAEEVCMRWFHKKAGDGSGKGQTRDWRTEFEWDRRIIFGDDGTMGRARL
jgi:alkylation response protein AidB-like acyl-CoA dehydrogenase